jgi:hypothetical protein
MDLDDRRPVVGHGVSESLVELGATVTRPRAPALLPAR